ncbi:hypothetical protein [Hymenobacter sp. BT188]|nr:hypothetical protein [Hymenobacter sp. BT188]
MTLPSSPSKKPAWKWPHYFDSYFNFGHWYSALGYRSPYQCEHAPKIHLL